MSQSPVDLDTLTVPELTALIEAAEAKRSGKMDGAKAAPSVREVVWRLEMISHFQRGGTEG